MNMTQININYQNDNGKPAIFITFKDGRNMKLTTLELNKIANFYNSQLKTKFTTEQLITLAKNSPDKFGIILDFAHNNKKSGKDDIYFTKASIKKLRETITAVEKKDPETVAKLLEDNKTTFKPKAKAKTLSGLPEFLKLEIKQAEKTSVNLTDSKVWELYKKLNFEALKQLPVASKEKLLFKIFENDPYANWSQRIFPLKDIAKFPGGRELLLKIAENEPALLFLNYNFFNKFTWGPKILMKAAYFLDSVDPYEAFYQPNSSSYLLKKININASTKSKLYQNTSKKLQNKFIVAKIVHRQAMTIYNKERMTKKKDNFSSFFLNALKLKNVSQRQAQKMLEFFPAVFLFSKYKKTIKRALQNFDKGACKKGKTNFNLKMLFFNFIKNRQIVKFLKDTATRNVSAIEDTWIITLTKKYLKAHPALHNNLQSTKSDLQVMIARNLFFKDKKITPRSVINEFWEIMDSRKEYRGLHLFKDRNVILAAHLEKQDDGSSRFGKKTLFDHIKKDGGKIANIIRPENDPASLNATKTNLLNKITGTSPPFTFIFDGHGGPSALYFSDGEIPGVTDKTTVVETENTTKITVSELFDAYKKRNLDPENRDIFILPDCFSSNFIRSFLQKCSAENIQKPIFIAESEYGQYAWSDNSEYGSQFYRNMWKNDYTPATIGNIMDSDHNNSNSNPVIYIPDEKNKTKQIS
jgi:hypothetical protein